MEQIFSEFPEELIEAMFELREGNQGEYLMRN
jgi:hypothetical protein